MILLLGFEFLIIFNEDLYVSDHYLYSWFVSDIKGKRTKNNKQLKGILSDEDYISIRPHWDTYDDKDNMKMFHIFTLVPSHWNFTHSHKYTPLYLKHLVKEAENSRERKKEMCYWNLNILSGLLNRKWICIQTNENPLKNATIVS